MRMYRQGDVLILEAKPGRGERTVANDKILVYGESTGHAHRVQSDTATVYDAFGGKEVDAPNGFALVHEEHDTIEIPEGYYRVIRQREYDEGQIRYVAD